MIGLHCCHGVLAASVDPVTDRSTEPWGACVHNVISDTAKVYAHIDQRGHEALVAQSKSATKAETTPVMHELASRGYTKVVDSWFDTEWDREIFILEGK